MEIDPADLASAIEFEMGQQPLDFRTRLLVRDSLAALTTYWGEGRVAEWLVRSSQKSAIESIRQSDLGPIGFPSLQQRIMDAIQPETVRQFLRDLGSHIHHPAKIHIGGAIALILGGQISRHTEDIDVVDEVPPELRSQHELLDRLTRQYGLRLTHFQSHYLPRGWEARVHSIGRFGQLDVFGIDEYDIFAGKFFSAREKDFNDLRMLARSLDKEVTRQRVSEAKELMSVAGYAEQAAKNWYIVYGDNLLTR